jgi:hypothetical protein
MQLQTQDNCERVQVFHQMGGKNKCLALLPSGTWWHFHAYDLGFSVSPF